MARSACFLLFLLLTAQPASSRWDKAIESKQQLRADGARAGAAAVEVTGNRFGITDASAASDASTAGAHVGTPGQELFKMTAANGAANDYLGCDVAISADGTLVVAGAYGDDDLGENAGAVYFIDGTAGTILRKVSRGVAGDLFGNRVAVNSDGTRVVVGALYHDGAAEASGKVYILDGTTGATLFEVTQGAGDEQEADIFGASLAISSDGSRIVVGAQQDDGAAQDAGAVYFLDGAIGTILRKVTAPDGARLDYFGVGVAISADGTRVAVGASGDDDRGSASGSVYVFEWATGNMILKMTAADGNAGDEFGASVALSSDGTQIAVGSKGDDDRGADSGAMYYGAIGTTLRKVTPADGGSANWFGRSVAITSDTTRIVVGADGDDDKGFRSGSLYVFDWASGEQLLKGTAHDQAVEDRIGLKIAINSDGTRIVAGSFGNDDVASNAGAVYMFEGAAAAPASATGDPHLQNIHGERFDLMTPGKVVLVQVPRGKPDDDALLTVKADARRLGAHCADLYFQVLNITGAWAEKAQDGGFSFDTEDGRHEALQMPSKAQGSPDRKATWLQVGPVELKVAHGRTERGQKYLNFFVKHLGRAGAAVGGLLGDDDHAEAATPSAECRKTVSLAKHAMLSTPELSVAIASL